MSEDTARRLAEIMETRADFNRYGSLVPDDILFLFDTIDALTAERDALEALLDESYYRGST